MVYTEFFARSTDYESRGQGFESSRAHQIQCYSHIQKLKSNLQVIIDIFIV